MLYHLIKFKQNLIVISTDIKILNMMKNSNSRGRYLLI